MLGGVERDVVGLAEELAGERVDREDALDLVAEEVDADRELLVGGEHGERVAADAERAADEAHVVAVVLHVDELAHDARRG